MQREREVCHEALARAEKEQRQQSGEGQHHQDDQRLGVDGDGPVERRRVGRERRVRRLQAAVEQRLRQLLPVLQVQMRIEGRAEHADVGQRLHAEEQTRWR